MISSMILKVVATGRGWGNKLDATEKRVTIGGVDCLVKEFDAWEGPLEAGKQGQFYRFTSFTPISFRDDRRHSGFPGEGA